MIIDAVETYLEGLLEKMYGNSDNVEDVDFSVQFAQTTDQHQWVNGQYHSGGYQPPTMTIVVPQDAKPGQIIQVSE